MKAMLPLLLLVVSSWVDLGHGYVLQQRVPPQLPFPIHPYQSTITITSCTSDFGYGDYRSSIPIPAPGRTSIRRRLSLSLSERMEKGSFHLRREGGGEVRVTTTHHQQQQQQQTWWRRSCHHILFLWLPRVLHSNSRTTTAISDNIFSASPMYTRNTTIGRTKSMTRRKMTTFARLTAFQKKVMFMMLPILLFWMGFFHWQSMPTTAMDTMTKFPQYYYHSATGDQYHHHQHIWTNRVSQFLLDLSSRRKSIPTEHRDRITPFEVAFSTLTKSSSSPSVTVMEESDTRSDTMQPKRTMAYTGALLVATGTGTALGIMLRQQQQRQQQQRDDRRIKEKFTTTTIIPTRLPKIIPPPLRRGTDSISNNGDSSTGGSSSNNNHNITTDGSMAVENHHRKKQRERIQALIESTTTTNGTTNTGNGNKNDTAVMNGTGLRGVYTSTAIASSSFLRHKGEPETALSLSGLDPFFERSLAQATTKSNAGMTTPAPPSSSTTTTTTNGTNIELSVMERYDQLATPPIEGEGFTDDPVTEISILETASTSTTTSYRGSQAFPDLLTLARTAMSNSKGMTSLGNSSSSSSSRSYHENATNIGADEEGVGDNRTTDDPMTMSFGLRTGGLGTNDALAQRYAELPLEDRAFQILVDLGMVEIHPPPTSPLPPPLPRSKENASEDSS